MARTLPKMDDELDVDLGALTPPSGTNGGGDFTINWDELEKLAEPLPNGTEVTGKIVAFEFRQGKNQPYASYMVQMDEPHAARQAVRGVMFQSMFVPVIGGKFGVALKEGNRGRTNAEIAKDMVGKAVHASLKVTEYNGESRNEIAKVEPLIFSE